MFKQTSTFTVISAKFDEQKLAPAHKTPQLYVVPNKTKM